jgi:hypothetical protein
MQYLQDRVNPYMYSRYKNHETFRMSKVQSVVSMLTSRKASVAVGIAIIFIAIIDLLTTRQILPYNNDTEAIIFILTIVFGYGIGSWILLSFTKRVSEDISRIGLYLSAIALSQDSSLRKSIKKSAVRLIDDIGSAQMKQQIEGKVMKLVWEQQKEIEEQTGGFSDEVSENELKEYIELVIKEIKHSTALDRGK